MIGKLSAVVGISVLVAALSAPGWASIQTLKVNHLARIQIGDPIDALPSISSEKTEFKLRHHLARFHLYYFDPSLPRHCMNLQCGRFAIRILAHGGFLMGGGDLRYLREAEGDAREPVLLVTDRGDRVQAIYRGLSRQQLWMALHEVFYNPVFY